MVDERRDVEAPSSASGSASGSAVAPEFESLLQAIAESPDKERVLALLRYSSGPLPAPGLLREYEQINPGLAQEIVSWTRTQQTHRQSLEQLQTKEAEKRQNRSQLFAFAVALTGIIASSCVAYFGQSAATTWFAVVAVLACVGGPATASVLVRYLDRAWSPPVGGPR